MEKDRLWKNVIEELKIVMAPPVFQTFVAKLTLIDYQNQVAVISCPYSYIAEQIKKRHYDIFKAAFDNQTKADNQIEFTVTKVPTSDNSITNTPLFSSANITRTAQYSSNLHPKYTLENLIVGNSNNFAYAAAQGIIKNPGLSYNPFFIWGGVGVGKTHLMQAIGHELLKLHPDFKVKYFPAETFGNELISALKSKEMNRFKEKYRQLDCILVDDIQFIAGKEYIQEEFFHTFNALHMNGKQVVLTSDRKPSEIKSLEDRLVSRFMGGLTVDIQPPDFEMRCAIITQKSLERGVSISPEAVQYLANNIESNTRDIEGRVQALTVQALTNRAGEIDLSFVQNFLSAAPLPSFSSSKLNPRHLISVCAKHFDIKTGDLCGQSRKKELVIARHLTAYLLLTEINLPLEEVGKLLGGRDHTSIMHARDKIAADLVSDSSLRQTLQNIKSAF